MIPECHNKKQPWETQKERGLADFGAWMYLFAFKDLIKLLQGKIEDKDCNRNLPNSIWGLIWGSSFI